MNKNIDDVAIIIQARLGSQRVKQKMIRPFAGTTLLDIVLEKINNSSIIKPENFYLSAYEDEIKNIGEKHGVQIFHRSEKSAKSEGTPMTDMYEWWDKLPHKYVVLINACAPMLTIETIDKFIKQYTENRYNGFFGVISKKNYFWNKQGRMITPWPEGEAVMNTKVVEPTLEAAHCLYAGKLDIIGDGIWMGNFTDHSPALFEMKEEEAFDIDYEWQFNVYEQIYLSKYGRSRPYGKDDHKVAVCYSGHLGKFKQAVVKNEKQMILPKKYDVYAFTSDAITEKFGPNHKIIRRPATTYKPKNNKIINYLPAKKGWRKDVHTYGIIYNIDKSKAIELLRKIFNNRLEKFEVEEENINVDHSKMTKWEWLKKNQWRRMYKCHQLMESSNRIYDIVIRARFDFYLQKKLDVVEVFKEHEGYNDDKVFVVGGWKNGKFMDTHLFDGFIFGSPKVMGILSGLYKVDKPYKYNPKYENFFKRRGVNSEYQVQEHFKHHGIRIVYLHKDVKAKVLR
jgi:CMP-N-acetylneuraminic acid synthetase